MTQSTTPKVGLVLGAGGIRGCAHAGVIEVLGEAGVPIDLVVGASVGSIFGLGVAAGLPTEHVVRAARDATPLDMFRFYAGRLRTDRRNLAARLLREAGEGKNFADLALPFAVMATDMTHHRTVTIDQGPVLPAVEASIALPFIARPVVLDGCCYADGGLLDTAPVHVARTMGADIVIAVCLGLNYAAPAFLRRRPWTQSVLHRLGRQQRPSRAGLHDQVRFSFRLYANSYDPPPPSADEADIAIYPELGSISPNSMFGTRVCYEAGVAAGRAALPAILETLRDAGRLQAMDGVPDSTAASTGSPSL